MILSNRQSYEEKTLTVYGLSDVCKGVFLSLYQADAQIEELLTDSRTLVQPSGALFFAINGHTHNGHKYLPELYEKGVRHFVVQDRHIRETFTPRDVTIFLVEDVVLALQQLAAWKRLKYPIQVIGITGSNAKTICKEWLFQLLSPDYRICKSPKSYNSQIGVPLSVWQLHAFHNLGIFEAGISLPGEMQRLQQVIRPNIGLFTNIGTAHDEGFVNRAEKIKEKLKLFAGCEWLLYRSDYPEMKEQMGLLACRKIAWSLHGDPDADWQVTRIAQSKIRLWKKGGLEYYFHLPYADEASFENLIHCMLLTYELGVDTDTIEQRIKMLKPVTMRLELKQGARNCYVIDDTYNNDLAGLTIALDFLSAQKQRKEKILVISDILQTGEQKNKLYNQVARLAFAKGVTRLVGIGAEISGCEEAFVGLDAAFYEDTHSFLVSGEYQKWKDEIVLVKGARVFGFEKIVAVLQQKVHGTILEINLDALVHNLNFYRGRLNPGTKLMVMVKAFAYGSGSLEVANVLQFHRVDYLAVAYTDEGVYLRENGIVLPIMVMNPSEESFDKMVQYRLEPDISNVTMYKKLEEYLERTGQRMNIHIELETGMNRLGFVPEDIPWLANELRSGTFVTVASIFSHLAGADEDMLSEYSASQFDEFEKGTGTIITALGYRPLRHILNSAGIVRFPEKQLDMVRLGIGLYGIEANGKEQEKLEVVGTLKTTISQIKKVEKGGSVGYGRKGKVEKDTRVGVIALGYGDGFNRRFGNGIGKVWVHGKWSPVIGNVCMDMTMIDLTGVEAEEGDEVVVFGKERPIQELASSIGTIPYEIMTGVSERVKRVFYSNK